MYNFMKKKYWLIMNMTSAACLKTVSRGQEKAGKVSGTKKKQLGKLLFTKSISERQSFSWAEFHQSAKSCTHKLWSSFRVMFLNIKLGRLWISHHILRSHLISYSTWYHQKIQRIWGNICVQGQGWKSASDACDVWARGQYCTENRLDSGMEISAWPPHSIA